MTCLLVCLFVDVTCLFVCVQCRQVEILLAGFKNRNEMVAILANEDMLFRRKDRKSWTTNTPHLSKLYTLVFRMTSYLEYSIVGGCVYLAVYSGTSDKGHLSIKDKSTHPNSYYTSTF